MTSSTLMYSTTCSVDKIPSRKKDNSVMRPILLESGLQRVAFGLKFSFILCSLLVN